MRRVPVRAPGLMAAPNPELIKVEEPAGKMRASYPVLVTICR